MHAPHPRTHASLHSCTHAQLHTCTACLAEPPEYQSDRCWASSHFTTALSVKLYPARHCCTSHCTTAQLHTAPPLNFTLHSPQGWQLLQPRQLLRRCHVAEQCPHWWCQPGLVLCHQDTGWPGELPAARMQACMRACVRVCARTTYHTQRVCNVCASQC